MNYAEALKHPKWQQKRLHIFELANFRCVRCGSGERSLHAHHKMYIKGRQPWEYEDGLLECLCELCHDAAHAQKEELEWVVAQQPTAKLSLMTNAVQAAVAGLDPAAGLPPNVRRAMLRLASALIDGEPADITNAQNALQDLIDETIDFRRGPGGARG